MLAALPPIPPDALVLLVGAAGAGKSTLAARVFPASTVLSSDDFRALVADDPADQSASGDAFRVLHAVASARLRRGLLTVVDATNLLASSRRPLLGLARRHGRPVVALVVEAPLETCLARNAARPARRVPDDVVRRHHAQLRRAMLELPSEGFALVVHVRTDGPEVQTATSSRSLSWALSARTRRSNGPRRLSARMADMSAISGSDRPAGRRRALGSRSGRRPRRVGRPRDQPIRPDSVDRSSTRARPAGPGRSGVAAQAWQRRPALGPPSHPPTPRRHTPYD